MTQAMQLSIKSIGYSYADASANSRWALEGFCLDISPGEVVSIVGPSGCGKTTILKLISGLLRPSSGMIMVDGSAGPPALTDVAFLFQTPRLLPWLTVTDNVRLALRLGKLRKNVHTTPDDMVQLVGLGAYADRYPDQLSGGMKQRVALARALVGDSRLLLMDEPFVGLDVATRKSMQELLLKLRSDLGLTVILVTHDLVEAVRLSTRVIVLHRTAPHLQSDIPVPTGLSPAERYSLMQLIEDKILSG
jgi:NitT/TauT family transport system ATP-binding protein